jgi:kinesin family protein 20
MHTYTCQVMIVHVNPYDTGFDENSHVMRFSAIAREIQTNAQMPTVKSGFPSLKRQISTQFSALKNAVGGTPHASVPSRMKIKVMVPVLGRVEEGRVASGREVKMASGRETEGFVMVEEEMEVVEGESACLSTDSC